ncbi:MAG: aerobic carbon-monoxide dehydrogenase small subunit, partial [Alphaproteobacteria bacterium]|nr:aerobic carbon-monoxide dehydrogenase small subunit [Alphaproteobacteria bacterium]
AYRLIPEDGGQSTRVTATIDYALQGVLAQFSRSGVAQEMGRIMVAQFAANLGSKLGAGGQLSGIHGDKKIPAAGKPVSARKVMWRALLNSYRGKNKR